MTRESIDVEGRAARGRTAVARPAWTLRATVGLLAVLMSNMLVTAAPSVSAAVVTSTTRVAVTVTGGQPTARTTEPDISDDGRFVAFSSAATNLVTGDTNAKSDVFVRDLQANTTTRVSVGTSGAQGNGNSENPALSSDGRYVAFETFSTNLTTPATSGNRTVMIHDRTTGTTEVVAISNGQAMGGIIGAASVSDDGRMVPRATRPRRSATGARPTSTPWSTCEPATMRRAPAASPPPTRSTAWRARSRWPTPTHTQPTSR